MDNKAIAGILYETADLLEIDGQDSFRIRSYRTAAQAIEALPHQIADIITEPKKLLEVPGIGKSMLGHLQQFLLVLFAHAGQDANLALPGQLFNSLKVAGLIGAPDQSDRLRSETLDLKKLQHRRSILFQKLCV